MLQYWLCERATIFEPRNGLEDKTPQTVRWDLHNISRALIELNLNDIEEDKISF